MAVIKSSNILVEHWLSIARNKDTHSQEFRTALENIGMILFSEAISNVKTLVSKRDIKTPLKRAHVSFVDEKNIYIIPILRAGLAMMSRVRALVPRAKVAHVGLYRNEKTLQPHWYLNKLPKKTSKKSVFFIMEPMLATGGTISTVLQKIIILGGKKIFVISALITENTKDKLNKRFGKMVDFYVAGIDPTLNHKGYIVPGLGDAGDRAFNL